MNDIKEPIEIKKEIVKIYEKEKKESDESIEERIEKSKKNKWTLKLRKIIYQNMYESIDDIQALLPEGFTKKQIRERKDYCMLYNHYNFHTIEELNEKSNCLNFNKKETDKIYYDMITGYVYCNKTMSHTSCKPSECKSYKKQD